MDDLKRALFVGLSVANIPPSAWDCQIFQNHQHHDGTVSQHSATLPSGSIAKMVFGIADGTKSHVVTSTCDIKNGHTTLMIDTVAAALPPTGVPQIDIGIEPGGSQLWLRYDDAGTLREFRLHTKTNLNFLANLLHLKGFPELAKVILDAIGV